MGYKQLNIDGEEVDAGSDESAPEPAAPRAVEVEVEEEPLGDVLDGMDGRDYESRAEAMLARAKKHRRERELAEIPDESVRRWRRVVDAAVEEHSWMAVVLNGSWVSHKTKGPAMNIVHLYVDELFIDECTAHPTKDYILAAIHQVTGDWVELRLYPTTGWGGASE
jgi:hypothetical protein